MTSRLAHRSTTVHASTRKVVCTEFVWDSVTHWCSNCGWNVAAHDGVTLFTRNMATIRQEHRDTMRRLFGTPNEGAAPR